MFEQTRFITLIPLVLFLAGPTPQAAASVAAEFFVSPLGADNNPGTKAKPFLTLTRARDEVRSHNRQTKGDIVINLRGGVYPIGAPVEFGPADSGFNGNSVIYRAYDKERPVLSGGRLVAGWVCDHDRIYKAKLNLNARLRSLYVNGVRANMTEANFKGKGPWGQFTVTGEEPWAETPGRTLDGIQFDASEVPAFENASDLELLQRRSFNFLILCAREITTESNRTIVKLQQPSGAIAASLAWGCHVDPKGAFTLRNAYELLRRRGQFYFNRTTQTLYYFSRAGEDMSKATVIAPLSEGLVQIAGTTTNDRVRNIVFSGITFACDHWQLEEVGGSRGMVGVQSLALYTRFRADGNWHKDHYDLCDLPQATFELRNCQNIRIERNRFIHLASGSAVSLVNDAVDCAIEGNIFNDLSGNAINVGHPQHYIIGDGPRFKAGIEGVCAHDVIRDNWIRNVSLDFKQEEAISGFFTEGVEISHNDIEGTPYGGIALGWWWGNAEIPPSRVPRDNVISWNRVVDTQQELPRDGGSIYVLGEQPGGRIEYNYIQSNTRLLYPDDGSAYWTLSRNVLDPRGRRPGANAKDGLWLHLWTPRIHDLRITDNYTTLAAALNKGTNCDPVNTRVENPLSREALAIAASAGLEPAYRDIGKAIGR